MSYAVMPLGGTSDTGDYPYYGLYNMDNTVSSDGCQVLVDYYDANGTSHISKAIPVTLGKWSSGNRVLCFDIRASMKPDDYVKTKRLLFQWGSGSLPSTGKYKMNLGFQVTEVPSPCTSVQFYTRKYIGNAKFQDAVENLEFTIQDNGKGAVYTMTSTKVVDFGNISYAEFRLSPDSTWDEMWSVVSGRVSIVLEKVDSSITTDITTAGGSYSSADAAADTAQNTSQIVQNTSEMNDTLKEIVQTISNQLEALWDQMYNLMHVPQLANDNKNTDRIVNKQQEQIENDNANTEAVTGAIERHGNFIIEGLKSLFIPSDEYFKSWFDGMYAFFNDRLGFFMLPVDVLIEFIDIFSASSEEFAGIPFPEFKWVDGTVVIPAQTVKFDFLETDWGKDIQTKMYFVGNVIMIGSLFHLIQQKLKEVTER